MIEAAFSIIAQSWSWGSQIAVKKIADYLIKKLIYDVNCVPFSFLFDESTNNQVKNNMGMFDTGHQGLIKLFLLMLIRYLLDIAIQMT